MRRAALISGLLHVAVALALVVGSLATPTSAPDPARSEAVVEMILKAPGSDDAPAGQPEPAAPAPAQQAADLAPPPSPPPAPAPPTPPDTAGEPSPEPSPAPSPAKPAAAPASAAPAAVRLGEGSPEGLTDDISGDIPASPDPSSPNLPPRYPAEAARRGQQGAVILTVTVAPNGTTRTVEIARSSGYALLDSAAQRAVARWHFKPGLDAEGSPVSSSMPIRIRFVLD